MYLWRAVDNEGEVLEMLVQPQRDKAAALREIGFSGLHEQGLRANNRAENSHRPG